MDMNLFVGSFLTLHTFVQSALINRILGRRRARTANIPGVTRSLQWIRVRTDEAKTQKKEFELLDSPGIIPANLVDQDDAALLAACNCIGEAAYDNQVRDNGHVPTLLCG
jgi:ribosome biogenesis GTPase A